MDSSRITPIPILLFDFFYESPNSLYIPSLTFHLSSPCYPTPFFHLPFPFPLPPLLFHLILPVPFILLFALAHLFPSPAKSLITHQFHLSSSSLPSHPPLSPSSSLPAVVEALLRDDGEAGASHSRGRGFSVRESSGGNTLPSFSLSISYFLSLCLCVSLSLSVSPLSSVSVSLINPSLYLFLIFSLLSIYLSVSPLTLPFSSRSLHSLVHKLITLCSLIIIRPYPILSSYHHTSLSTTHIIAG